MTYKNGIEKFIEIFKRSNLSISKFASLIQKDRRTVTSWIDNISDIEPNEDVKDKICNIFRYPDFIWEDGCSGEEFIKSITQIPQKEVRIIDEDYYGRLKYIMELEKNRRFVIQAQFPGPMYRDTAVKKVYRTRTTTEIEELKQERIEQMLRYDYDTTEWYSIKSILSFCFASIGNFYTKEEKVKILELMYELFHNNYNKKLFLFDSFSRKIYGMETTYISINVKQKILFFKSPIESVFIEIRNKNLVERMHKYYSSPVEAPSHVNFLESVKILKILQDAVRYNNNITQAYEAINRTTNYGELFYHNLSIDLQKEVTPPKPGQKRN
jgi:transcriptional regulator with XRE-family HTH domain